MKYLRFFLNILFVCRQLLGFVDYFDTLFHGVRNSADRQLAAMRQEKRAQEIDPERYCRKVQFREMELVHDYDETGIIMYELPMMSLEEFQLTMRYFCLVETYIFLKLY